MSAVGLTSAHCSLSAKERGVVMSLSLQASSRGRGRGKRVTDERLWPEACCSNPHCCLSAGGPDSSPTWDGEEPFLSVWLLEVSTGNRAQGGHMVP